MEDAGGTGAGAAQRFAELFPPLTERGASSLEQELHAAAADDDGGRVDISTDAIALRPLEQQVEEHIYEALRRWNARVPASSESTMGYMLRLKRYRAIVRWLLYENEDADDDDEGSVANANLRDPSPHELRRAAKQQSKLRRAQIKMYKQIFGALPSIATLRELRRPGARVERFLEAFPVKKKLLATKRSVADTQSSLCFTFARKPRVPSTPRGGRDEGDGASGRAGAGDENAVPRDAGASEIQRPTATTAATWRSRTLLASLEQQQRQTARAASHPRAEGENTGRGDNAEEEDELVLWIDVLHATKDAARTQSFLVLGSQRLTALLDLVVCAYDQRLEAQARHSKLLYFDGQFYVDRRRADNADYARNILEWIHAKPSRAAKYLGTADAAPTVKTLETTAFAELALKPDVAGVYIHQGECEHVVRLRDVRLHDPAVDSIATDEDFPMRLPNQLYRQLRSCLACNNYSAKFVCYGDRMGISDPMFFCERCYRAAHYDRDGKLLSTDFQAFPFIQE